eukprot:NODE_3982_length_505_cov_129.379386_g3395_i0.p4 GENE.NODE_3982_length_505_cov_129.379386_g3395_i0~~NODE_3982_length_505_cov_129.379386_g3395_i0.p4  ORF type:complete len:58 (-),score=18.91 NODE_3982_length_505_cov_129.379386_g3395_i0:258-431(-)
MPDAHLTALDHICAQMEIRAQEAAVLAELAKKRAGAPPASKAPAVGDSSGDSSSDSE